MEGLEMKYFVLKPRGDNIFAKASRVAMLEYADIIYSTNKKLAGNIREWVSRESCLAYNSETKGE